MKPFQVAYIPIGVPTFHLESAQIEFEKSIRLLSSLTDDGVYPDKMLLSLEELCTYLDTLNPELIVLQNITFANAAYASEVLRRFDCPVLLWTLREPVIDGGRLRLNSLTGAYSAGNVLQRFRNGEFEYIFGSPQEELVSRAIAISVRAAKVKYKMKLLKMAAIGHTPQGFGFGRAQDDELLQAFGVTLESIEARELIERAKGFEDDDCVKYLEEAKQLMVGLDEIPERNIKDFARLYKAYKNYIEENQIGALASRCWPDFFTAFGTPVCSVLAMLNSAKIAASCESDIYGALSMFIGTSLTDKPTFFGDPVSMDEDKSTITFWHCGMAACTLARQDTGARVGVHPNRKIGPVMDFGCKACERVTVFRVGRKGGAFRFFITSGEALDCPKQFCGTSIVVKTETSAKEVVYGSVKAGWEPHFVIAYGDIAAELEVLGHMLGIEVCHV